AAGGRLLVCPHNGRVDHQILVLAVSHQLLENPLPDAAARPANEALVHAFVLAIMLGKIVPACSGTQDPKHSVHKQTVVGSGAAYMLFAARKKARNPFPLQITQLIAVRHPSTSAAQTIRRKVYMSIPPRNLCGGDVRKSSSRPPR